MTKNKKILHIDVDNFFIAVEKTLNNSIDIENNIVVISMNNKKGMISTSNYKARSLGICAGMPLFKAKNICPNLVVIEPKLNIYKKISELIFQHLLNITKLIEIYSIDEWYIDITANANTYYKAEIIAQEIANSIKKKFNINVSIGISYTKWLAKTATNFGKPNGIFTISEQNTLDILKKLCVKKILYIGKTKQSLLISHNIKNVNDLIIYKDKKYLINILGYSNYKMVMFSIYGLSDNAVINNKNIDNDSYSFSTVHLNKTMDFNNKNLYLYIEKWINNLKIIILRKNIMFKSVFIKYRLNSTLNKWKIRTYTLKNYSNSDLILLDSIFYLLDKWIDISDKITGFGIGIDKIINSKNSCLYSNIFKSNIDYNILEIINKVNKKMNKLSLTTLKNI